jgi:hypothetical protein
MDDSSSPKYGTGGRISKFAEGGNVDSRGIRHFMVGGDEGLFNVQADGNSGGGDYFGGFDYGGAGGDGGATSGINPITGNPTMDFTGMAPPNYDPTSGSSSLPGSLDYGPEATPLPSGGVWDILNTPFTSGDDIQPLTWDPLTVGGQELTPDQFTGASDNLTVGDPFDGGVNDMFDYDRTGPTPDGVGPVDPYVAPDDAYVAPYVAPNDPDVPEIEITAPRPPKDPIPYVEFPYTPVEPIPYTPDPDVPEIEITAPRPPKDPIPYVEFPFPPVELDPYVSPFVDPVDPYEPPYVPPVDPYVPPEDPYVPPYVPPFEPPYVPPYVPPYEAPYVAPYVPPVVPPTAPFVPPTTPPPGRSVYHSQYRNYADPLTMFNVSNYGRDLPTSAGYNYAASHQGIEALNQNLRDYANQQMAQTYPDGSLKGADMNQVLADMRKYDISAADLENARYGRTTGLNTPFSRYNKEQPTERTFGGGIAQLIKNLPK